MNAALSPLILSGDVATCALIEMDILYDADFDFVAEITRQPMQWVVPRGTVP